MTRKTLAEYGPKGAKVRVFIETGGELVRVQWRQGGAVQTKSWSNTRAGQTEAKAWAKGFAEARDLPRETPRLTLREMWDAFRVAEFPHLRANTQRLYEEYWLKWETTWGRHFLADDTTREMMDQFRRALERQHFSVASVGQAIKTAKMVYRWAEGRELLSRNRLALYRYKVAKDKRQPSPAEYRGDEFRRLLAQLDPASGSQWRAHVALALCGYQGVRQRAALHLQWADVALEGPDGPRVTWRSQWDKQGREWSQPLRAGAVAALEAARAWRERSGYAGPWVLPPGSSKSREEVYSAQSLWASLKAAERRAGIAHAKGRAAHGLRRMLAGDVAEATGDALLGLQAIGDTDIRQAQRYLKKRDERVRDAFSTLDNAQTDAEPVTSDRNQTVTRTGSPEGLPAEGED